MSIITTKRQSLLSPQARVQAPWIKVTLGSYTFGVFSKTTASTKDAEGFYSAFKVTYPNYVQSLQIVKINGQVNQYTLQVAYPVGLQDDPNFFEKVLSSVSKTRKIVFSYGDAMQPNYIYKDEEAIITNVRQSFGFGQNGQSNSVITYTISAVSGAALGQQGSFTFLNSGKKKPSDEIKRIFKTSKYGLSKLFTGMSAANIDSFVAGDDKAVELESKTNISPLDYVMYLTSCMVPADSTQSQVIRDIYLLTIHDDTAYDRTFTDELSLGGPYFKVTRTSYARSNSDAFEIDIGYNTSTIVTNFQIENQENFSLYYDYTNELQPNEYVRRINDKGQWEDVFAPTFTSKNNYHKTRSSDTA